MFCLREKRAGKGSFALAKYGRIRHLPEMYETYASFARNLGRANGPNCTANTFRPKLNHSVHKLSGRNIYRDFAHHLRAPQFDCSNVWASELAGLDDSLEWVSNGYRVRANFHCIRFYPLGN
jgi:hypothetical protein